MNARVVLKFAPAVVIAAALVVMVAAASAAPKGALMRVSQDKLSDTIGVHQVEVQPALAADATSKTLVAVFEVGRAYNGGATAIGWSTSNNGGKSFKNGLLPLTILSGGPGATYRGADPSVAYNKRYK